MNRLRNILLCLLVLFSSGCYEEKVKEATSKLKIGMTKTELDHLFKDLTFLKEQTVLVYPNLTEAQTRALIWNERHYKDIHPKDLIANQLTFDGSIKVYSYFVREERSFANPTLTHFVAVFLNQKEDKVIGWGYLTTNIEPRLWDDKF